MDEQEWLATTDARLMVSALPRERNNRALRFFACCCCRLASDVITDERSRAAIEVTELYLSGRATERQYYDAIDGSNAAREDARLAREAVLADPNIRSSWEARSRSMSATISTHLVHYATSNGYYDAMFAHIRDALGFGGIVIEKRDQATLLNQMCDFCRDIFGNPFRPVTLNPAWRTSDVVALARGMYDQRDFSAMPILADALQDAGCDNDDVLNHCRDASATHVRGCWVVDLVLGKE